MHVYFLTFYLAAFSEYTKMYSFFFLIKYSLARVFIFLTLSVRALSTAILIKKSLVGLMLLSEVALGEVYELKKAKVNLHSLNLKLLFKKQLYCLIKNCF